ncbi:MAG: hypothetical protein U0359_26035 [Byssovorax sp.]
MHPTISTRPLHVTFLLATLALASAAACGPRGADPSPPPQPPPRSLPPQVPMPHHALPHDRVPAPVPDHTIAHAGLVCAPPPGYAPPTPRLQNGAACTYAVQCQGGVCAGGVCVEPGAVMGCAQKYGPGSHGVLTSGCAGMDAYPICLGPGTAPPPDVCNADNSCCDLGSPCSDHAQCCSGTCYAPPGKTAGVCVDNTTRFAEVCPYSYAAKIYQKTDPISYCVPEPQACAASGCKIVEAVTSLDASCFRRASGDVYCWGRNDKKQLGDGTTTKRDYAAWAPVKGLSDAVQIAAVETEFCAVRASGQVVCWGNGQDLHPAGVDGMAQIALGPTHRCGVTKGGTVACWGSNDFGQLGTGNNAPSPTPVLVAGLSGARKVTVGFRHSCALRADGHVVCWGAGNKLGNGGTGNSYVPVEVSGVGDAIDIASANGSCAVLRSGALTCWRTLPAQVGGGTGLKSIAADWSPLNLPEQNGEPLTLSHLCGVRQDGHVTCWLWGATAPAPANQTDQLEAFDGSGQALQKRPLSKVAAYSQRYWSGCAVKESGEVLCGSPGFDNTAPGLKPLLGTRPLP